VHARRPWASSTRGGSTRWWRTIRATALRETPLCPHCAAEGRVALSAEAHHIVPKSQGGTDQLDNIAVMCAAHHRQLTQAQPRRR
jgi:5-methylcytosine-specific restriction protein A